MPSRRGIAPTRIATSTSLNAADTSDVGITSETDNLQAATKIPKNHLVAPVCVLIVLEVLMAVLQSI